MCPLIAWRRSLGIAGSCVVAAVLTAVPAGAASPVESPEAATTATPAARPSAFDAHFTLLLRAGLGSAPQSTARWSLGPAAGLDVAYRPDGVFGARLSYDLAADRRGTAEVGVSRVHHQGLLLATARWHFAPSGALTAGAGPGLVATAVRHRAAGDERSSWHGAPGIAVSLSLDLAAGPWILSLGGSGLHGRAGFHGRYGLGLGRAF